MVKDLKVKLGDKVSEGNVILTLETTGGAAAAAAPAQAATAATAAPQPARTAGRAGYPHRSPPRRAAAAAAPADRRRKLQEGACLAVGARVRARARRRPVEGQGHRTEGAHPAGGRAELRQAGDERSGCRGARRQPTGGAALGLLPWPQVDFAKFGPVESKPLSRIKKISGANLHRNWVLIPHVTNHDDADITDLEAFRVELNKENEKAGIKVTMLAFLIKACVAALKKFPEFNASLDGENLIFKKYFHIGFAADTPNGLVVPVIKNADQKGVLADRQGNGRTLREGARRQARSGRHAGRLLLDLEPRRHRRHVLHADHQRAGSRDPRRLSLAACARSGTASNSRRA